MVVMSGRQANKAIQSRLSEVRVDASQLLPARLEPSLQDRGPGRGYMTRLPIQAIECNGLGQGDEPDVWYTRTGLIVLDYGGNDV